MGAITPDKKLYDQATVDFFVSRGWQAFAITRTGRFADVLAIKSNYLAVIEVKSVKETSADINYDDSARLSPRLNASICPFIKTIRKTVMALFPRGKSLEKLYAATIAAQIFRYIHEFEEMAAKYEKFTGSITLQGVKFEKQQFLVVPKEYAGELESTMEVLKKNRVISSFHIEQTPQLVIAGFSYP